MGKGVKSALINNGGNASKQASTIAGQLTPQLQAEAANPEGYTPQQQAYMNTASQQSLGGGEAATTGGANLTAARTRNAGGFQGAVATANRGTQKQASENAVQNATAQANLQQQQRQSALTALQNLYGTNLTGSNTALNEANQTPNEWNQLLNSSVQAAGSAAGAYACPAEGSLILMADGSEQLVETLRAGDRIAGIGGDVCIVEDVPSCCGDVIRVSTDDGFWAINSPSHDYALPLGGFTVAAKSLGQRIVTAKGSGKVVSVETAGKARIFNILTDGSHTYRADGVWALGVGDAERYDSMLMADTLVP